MSDNFDKMAPRALNIRSIPRYLRQKFKEMCVREGVSMEEKAIELIGSAVYHQNPRSSEKVSVT